MNIMQYRAIKAQEAQASASAPTQTAPTVPTNQTTPAHVEQPKETKPTETPVETKPVVPEKIAIEGVGEVSIDELKNGYLRQSDYTKKTQEVAKQRMDMADAINFFENAKKNPELLRQIGQTQPELDPVTLKVRELEKQVYDMMLEREISTLQTKYPDFELREVLAVAEERKTTNLEDAYLLAKSRKTTSPTQTVDVEALKKQIREQLIKEQESERSATQTIITTQATPVVSDNTPKLSEAEKKVAKMMKLSEDDYLKWKFIDKKK